MIKPIDIKLRQHTMRGYHHTVGSNECVVMLHGYTGNCNESRTFKMISDTLEKEHIDTLRVSYLGHGDSDLLFRDLDFDFLMEQVNQIINKIKEMGYHKIHLLGYSMGGFLSLHALDHLIESVILISPAFHMGELLLEDYQSNSNKLDDDSIDIGGLKLTKKFVDSFQNTDIYKYHKTYQNQILTIIAEEDEAIKKEWIIDGMKPFHNYVLKMIPGCNHGYSSLTHKKKLLEYIVSHLT
jgi:esterase/lipase